MRTTLIVALISILVLLIPYLPIRRGFPPLLAPTESGVAPTTLSNKPSPSLKTEDLQAKDLARDPKYSETESFDSRPMIEETPVIQDSEIVQNNEIETRESPDSEPQLQTDSLDDLDSFLDSEQLSDGQ